MIEIHEEIIQDIPVTHIVASTKRTQPLPTIFFFQRFTASKELDIGLGYILAKAGYRVLFPEAPQHGMRFDGNEEKRKYQFWNILKQSIDELPILYHHYKDCGLILDDRVGVTGTSLGGFIVLGSMTQYRWIKAGASYMGSGFFLSCAKYVHPPVLIKNVEDELLFNSNMSQLKQYDITYQLAKLADRPLFVWHGEKDDIVSVNETIKLKKAFLGLKLDKQPLIFIDNSAGHKINHNAIQLGVAFFKENL